MGQWERPDGSQTAGLGLSSVTLEYATLNLPAVPNIPNAGNPLGGASASIDLSFAPGSEASFRRTIPTRMLGTSSRSGGRFGALRMGWASARLGLPRSTANTAGITTSLPLVRFVLVDQAGGNLGDFCAATNTNALLESAFNLDPGTIKANGLTITNVPGGLFEGAFVTSSEVQRWGLGVVQEIDAAAMHVFARWQHQSIDLDITGI